MPRRFIPVVVCLIAVSTAVVLAQESREWKSGIVWPEPKVVDPGPPGGVPADAVVLFDGKDLSKWEGGETWLVQDGVAEIPVRDRAKGKAKGKDKEKAQPRVRDIRTKDKFGDFQLHLEFATPAVVEGRGQGRGNSGVFLADRYEIQILDSYDNKTYFDGMCASIYKQTPPMVNACRKPGEWQTYDIIFEMPHFTYDGGVKKPGYVTLFHNGVAVLNHFELLGNTNFDRPPAYQKHPEKMPIHLQNHGNPVRFRNIWIRELTPIEGKRPPATTAEG
jgi:hypothetical protein